MKHAVLKRFAIFTGGDSKKKLGHSVFFFLLTDTKVRYKIMLSFYYWTLSSKVL